jgi:alpha-tubulin suppressor-like RCC1 family protein
MAAVTQNGQLLTWGNPDKGKLGHTIKEDSEEEKAKKLADYKTRGYSPKNYADLTEEMDFVYGDLDGNKVKEAVCGFYHTVALTESGDVYTWGEGKQGALGHGDWETINMPRKVEGISNVTQISAGGSFSMALSKDGKLYSWGQNRYG